MCGIAGIWGDVTLDRLKAMAAVLRHRGPDDEGYWTAPQQRIGFAHRRLAIIDPATGHQPVANEDGGVVAVFNGAIYNYRELREELIGRGHHLKTQSDSEVIVHLYEECGADVATKLRGMFAIAIWDDANRQLVLMRDRVGKKPLYYAEAADEFLFASQIRGVAAARGSRLTLDLQAVADYLAWSSIPAPATVYREVRAVEPGELLVVRDRRVAQRQSYWRQAMQPKHRLSRGEAVEQVDEIMNRAVRLRLRADVPVGVFLSGGMDSGIVTAMAARECSGRLSTITVGFEDDTFDERPLARLVAQRYDTEHHEVVIRSNVAADLPTIAEAYDQPFGDSSAVPSYYVARAAREFTKVVLNGDGGDELFAGYRRYVAARISGLLSWLDGPNGRPMWEALSHLLPTPRGFRSPYAFAHRLIRGMGMDPARRYVAWAIDGVDERGLHALCGVPVSSRKATRESGTGMQLGGTTIQHGERLARAVLEKLGSCGPVDRMMGTDFATTLPDDLLVKMDIATMAHGLEARSPLLDHELVEVVSRYPEHVKLAGLRTKPVLRALSRRYVPSVIADAPKRGFEIPVVRWLRGELRELCEDVVLAHDGLLADLFDRSALERLLRRGGASSSGDERLDPARWGRRVWLLLMLGMWDRVAHKTRRREVET